MPAISFQSVSKTYPPVATATQPGQARRCDAVDDVDFDIEEGEFFGLLGPERRRQDHADQHPRRAWRAPTRGTVARASATTSSADYAAGAPAARRRAAGAGVRPVLHACARRCASSRGYFGVHEQRRLDRRAAATASAWPTRRDANMRQLSGGMKRRVLVAQALVHRPPVIVLDEPTAGVDVELRQTLWQFVARLNKRRPHGAADDALPGRGRGAVPAASRCSSSGRVVALDRTSALLRRHREHDAALQDRPAAAGRRSPRSARVTGRIVQLHARTTRARSSRSWRALREAGAAVEDLEIGRADLEDVFLEIMHGRRAERDAAEDRRRSLPRR